MTDLSVNTDWGAVTESLHQGARLVGMFGTASRQRPDGVRLSVVIADGDQLGLVDREVVADYPALTPAAPGAFAYERALHDHFGVLPRDHPRLDPLVLAELRNTRGEPASPTWPGSGGWSSERMVPQESALPRYLHGAGLFTIPHGPVRSGVMESMEYLVETPGEDIPRLQVRLFAKHRAVELGFEGRDPGVGVLLAERVEGTASVAHATAYCQALERSSGTAVPWEAALVRLVHAELERVVGHLEVVARLCEAAGLAVGLARFTLHKEELQRIRHSLCGSRFGRDVVVPGGVVPLDLDVVRHHLGIRLTRQRDRINRDRDLLMVTSSFLDRLRGTGYLDPERARTAGAVGPVGRASGTTADVRRDRPYDAYLQFAVPHASRRLGTIGDVQARLEVRWEEIEASFGLVDRAFEELAGLRDHVEWSRPVEVVDGRSVGSVEGPQGEVVYVVEVHQGRLRRVWPRTASFHNVMLFHDVFHSDVLTDFPFIEASFAVSNAGAVM